MMKLTKNVYKMVQNRPTLSLLRGGFHPFFPHLGGGPCLFFPANLMGGTCHIKNF